MRKYIPFILVALFVHQQNGFAQRGKDGARTITAPNTIINEYTALTADAAAGATSVSVISSGLNTNGRFSGNLAPGDLVMVIQMQGAGIDATPDGAGISSLPNSPAWGTVLNYNNVGHNEIREVASIPNATTITFTCALSNSYTASGRSQVIRLPRYTTLTVNNGASITGQAWNGTTGGVVAAETLTSLSINSTGAISANALGFRGGTVSDNNSFFGAGFYAAPNDGEGSEKGESIAGDWAVYDVLGGRFCMGAPANGGGGGTAHNAGGGGGANGGDPLAWNGLGNPDLTGTNWATAWDLESPGFSGNTSSGGGKGGYTWSNNAGNALTTAPEDPAWGGDNRREKGGLGGRPMDYSTGRIFLGGGGGAGDQNDGDGGPGGRGGGIVYLLSYGTVSGTGTITANGANGSNSDASSPSFSGYAGIDGAGGGGGGGAIIINSIGAISGISATANGGNGGNQNWAGGPFASTTYNPAYGPGGGGGGGYIAISNGTITRTTNGGNNGTTNSSALTEFTPNGATRGGSGTNNASVSTFDLTASDVTICSGNSATLNATANGTLPGMIHWYDSQFGNTIVGTGASFTTPVLTSTTTYYVGVCPGSFRIPVTVNVTGGPVIDDSNISISNETCAGNDGSITGITVSGSGLTYTWNGNPSAGPDLLNTSSGSYTLEVSDGSCTSSSGPYIIGSSGGPVIDVSGLLITPTSCGNSNGSITGITATGTGTLIYEWNGTSSSSADTSNAAAGSYTLTVTDGGGCSSSVGPFTIPSSTNPSIDVSSLTVQDATCGSNNGSITGITVSGGTTPYSFEWNGNPSATLDISSLGTGSYSLVVNDAAGCSATAGPLIINAIGGATINDSNATITATTCGQNNGSITGILVSGGTNPITINWNGTPSPGVDISNLPSGNYSLEIIDGNGCSTTSGPYTIGGSTGVIASATGTDASCNGYNNGAAVASASGGITPYTFQWIGGPASDTYSGITAGNYQVIVNDNSGCSDTASVTINEPAAINLNLTGTTQICEGQSSTLTASGVVSYLWNTGNNTPSINVSPTSTTNYTVIGSDGSCSDTASITVVVDPLPVASITGTLSYCEESSTVLTAAGGDTYAWSTGGTGTSETLSLSSSGVVFVVATNSCGNDTASVSVTVFPNPTADAGSDVTIALGNGTTLTGSGGTTFSWSPSSGLNCTNCQSPFADPTQTTDYILVVTDANGCSDSDTVRVIVDAVFGIFIPDAFSPNGDGSNDELFVRGNGIEEFVFRVYDRWGEKVFETTDQQQSWDGTFRGKKLNGGVFVYILDGTYLNNEKFTQKGNITLVK